MRRKGQPEPSLWDIHCNADRAGLFCNWTPEPNTGCIIWTGRSLKSGHGMVSMCCRSLLTHRCVYRLLVEDITNELDVHHVCEQPACINPRHLIALTPEQHKRVHSGRSLAWVSFVGATTRDQFEPLDVFEAEVIGFPFKPKVFDLTPPRVADAGLEVRR